MDLFKDMLLKTTFSILFSEAQSIYALKILGFFQMNQGIVAFVFR